MSAAPALWESETAAAVCHGSRLRLPGPPTPVLDVLGVGYGWCELTSRALMRPAFGPVGLQSRERFVLPPFAREIFSGLTARPVLCLNRNTGTAVEVLLVDVELLIRTLCETGPSNSQLRWAAGEVSAWRGPTLRTGALDQEPA